MTHFKFLGIAALLGAAMLPLASCGGDDEPALGNTERNNEGETATPLPAAIDMNFEGAEYCGLWTLQLDDHSMYLHVRRNNVLDIYYVYSTNSYFTNQVSDAEVAGSWATSNNSLILLFEERVYSATMSDQSPYILNIPDYNGNSAQLIRITSQALPRIPYYSELYCNELTNTTWTAYEDNTDSTVILQFLRDNVVEETLVTDSNTYTWSGTYLYDDSDPSASLTLNVNGYIKHRFGAEFTCTYVPNSAIMINSKTPLVFTITDFIP